MKLWLVISATIIMILSCEERHFSDDSYKPFEMTNSPDETITYYPEESIIFQFNSEIDDGVVAFLSFIDSEDNECSPTVKADDTTLVISDFPPQSDVIMSVLRGFRSSDSRLLTETTEYGIMSKEFEFFFHIGPAFPSLISTLPEKVASATVALSFSEPVRLKKEHIIPTPDELITEASTAILLYTTPQEEIVLSGITTPIRPGIIPDIIINGEDKDSQDCVIEEAKTAVGDHSATITFVGKCLLAFLFEEHVTLCQQGRCVIQKDNLTADSDYSFSVTLFSIDGQKKEKVSIHTELEKAHIIISEVMHSPSQEPEKSHEFIELYNASSLPFELANCLVDDKNDSKGVDPLLGDSTLLAPGATALIVGNESMLTVVDGNILFMVDDTTIADAGLTSTESIQIICPGEEGAEIVASYSATAYGKRGYSVVIEKDGTTCDSTESGGTPGVYTQCP